MRGMRRIDRDGRLKGEQTVEFHSKLPFNGDGLAMVRELKPEYHAIILFQREIENP